MNFAPRHTFLLLLATVALLVGASYIRPSDSVPFVQKVDILSALRSDAELYTTAGYQIDTAVYDQEPISDTIVELKVEPKKDIAKAVKKVKRDSAAKVESKSVVKVVEKTIVKEATQPVSAKSVTAIEDFSSGAITVFCDKLRGVNGMNRPLRIAVLGDSFIEGDIFTQDLRAMLQRRFGGRGVGFVPVASNVSGFRQTVKHAFNGWSTHSIKSNAKRGGYVLSSYTFTPGAGNSVTYWGSNVRPYLSHFSRARFMFINRNNSKIKAIINGGSEQVFTPPSSSEMQQVVVFGDTITSVRFEVLSSDGFTGYGAFLDGVRGVCVDNFSVRGNSGVTLVATDGSLMTQMNSIVPYDLIVLEYGLNVAQADVKSYTTYLNQMTLAVNHIKRSFPGAAIVIMSVPDRARRTADGFATMAGVEAMARVQRDLARNVGAGYWSTLDAMKARGGMGVFVKNGWAAKDYTHLSHKGGRELAHDFYEALMLKVNGNE